MGRHKKNDSSVLVGIVNDFYQTEACGNPGKLKYSALAQYAQSRGIQADWYDFRRDGAVLRRIQELRERVEPEEAEPFVPAYKSLDIEELLRNSRTVEDLKRKLYELDGYWKKAYERIVNVMSSNQRMSVRKSRDDAEIHRLELENERLISSIALMESKMKELEKEGAYLRGILRRYLYPSVANKLLGESGLSKGECDAVRPESFSELIEGDTPEPFDGMRQSASKERNRQEELLAAMRKQVNGDGTWPSDSGNQ